METERAPIFEVCHADIAAARSHSRTDATKPDRIHDRASFRDGRVERPEVWSSGRDDDDSTIRVIALGTAGHAILLVEGIVDHLAVG